MDVPAANCVIRFDPMLTSVSLTQSKGRARQAGSSFVVLAERPDRTVRDLEEAERVQAEVCAAFTIVPKTAAQIESKREAEREKQRARERGAKLKLDAKIAAKGGIISDQNSIMLLNQLCGQTKVDLITTFEEGGCSLTYESTLRVCRGRGVGVNPKKGKRAAATALLRAIRAELE